MLKGIALTIVCAGVLVAQTANTSTTAPGPSVVAVQAGAVGVMQPVAIARAFAGPMSTVAGAPYSAQTSTERVQFLSDGNRIDQTSTGSVARDSQGRVRREETLPALGGNAGEAPHLAFIDDPVAGVHWNLDPQRKIAFKMPFMQIKTAKPSAGAAESNAPVIAEKTWLSTQVVGGATLSSVQISDKGASGQDIQVSKTDLGTQTVQGVPAKGTRITRTIPAGAIGNDMPIVITTETWYSPDLKVLVMSKTSDPRMGDTTYTLTNIQRSDPPAGLFQVPDDYTVKDEPNDLVFHEAKKNE